MTKALKGAIIPVNIKLFNMSMGLSRAVENRLKNSFDSNTTIDFSCVRSCHKSANKPTFSLSEHHNRSSQVHKYSVN